MKNSWIVVAFLAISAVTAGISILLIPGLIAGQGNFGVFAGLLLAGLSFAVLSKKTRFPN